EKHSDELKKKHHPLLGNPTISITLIEGGTTPWIIPENCKIVIDRRTLPGENSKSVLEELESIILKIKETDPEMVSEVSILQEACPAEISPREEIVSAVLNEASSVLGRNVEIIGMSGTTDARFLINDAKIPTVIFGPGSLAQAHQPDEYVNHSETYLAAKIYARIALRL
ncbi:MAG: M20/M25/M40 family metallo-hydrolase, partial [Thermoproteota archaeon]